jgi:hypothetical protein
MVGKDFGRNLRMFVTNRVIDFFGDKNRRSELKGVALMDGKRGSCGRLNLDHMYPVRFSPPLTSSLLRKDSNVDPAELDELLKFIGEYRPTNGGRLIFPRNGNYSLYTNNVGLNLELSDDWNLRERIDVINHERVEFEVLREIVYQMKEMGTARNTLGRSNFPVRHSEYTLLRRHYDWDE